MNIEKKTNQVLPSQFDSELDNISTLKPLFRQYTNKFIGILFSIAFAVLFTLLFFQQYHAQTVALINGELTPLKLQVAQFTKLNKYQQLIKQLLSSNQDENIIEYHSELIALDNQLLQLKNKNSSIFQQWLRDNKATTETVSRIQLSHSKNQQLKQSTVIQLQLMLHSITRIVDTKSVQQLYLLKQFKNQITEALVRFEQLTINTSQQQFELLRTSSESVITQAKALKMARQTKSMVELVQQVNTFKGIVLTEQRALAKWQGFLRLTQSYQQKLHIQQQQLSDLLSKVFHAPNTQKNQQGMIGNLFLQYNIHISNKTVIAILLSCAVISLLSFGYLLWLIRQQIKLSAKQGVSVIKAALLEEFVESSEINSAETNEILVEITKISKPKHSDLDFQQLLDTCEKHESTIQQQHQEIQQLSDTVDEQQVDNNKQCSRSFNGEMQRYTTLKSAVVSLIQYSQVNVVENISQTSVSLAKLYERIELFNFINYLQYDAAVLKLNDINFINDIYAVLLNKHLQHQLDDQQLFFSVNQSLQHHAKVDDRLFVQLVSLLIDINFIASSSAQCHLQLQLQDKSAGQQHVQFKLNVNHEDLDTIPEIIETLVNTQVTSVIEAPLILEFHLLLTGLHGGNLSAQLTEEGYQFTFELPLALADDIPKMLDNSAALHGVNLVLFSSNKMLNKQINDVVNECSGKIAQFTRIDSFEQYFNVKALTKTPYHLLIIAAEKIPEHFDYIEKQLAALPSSMQPKIMLLQTAKLNKDVYGLFSLAEQPFCQSSFVVEVEKLLASEHKKNQLQSAEQCQLHNYIASPITALLVVKTPQQYQTLQRLLNFLGLQTHIVTTEEQQYIQWKTGRYCLLITEFIDNVFLDMANIPLANIGVFSLVDRIKQNENFSQWHIGVLAKDTMLAELSQTLSSWLNEAVQVPPANFGEYHQFSAQNDLIIEDEVVITEIAISITQRPENEIAFDFGRYLQHQGSVEAALFMLEDYSQDNHAKLDLLVLAIKAKDISKASDIISKLHLNAKILAANDLQSLCTQWVKLLSGSEVPKSLDKVNALLKDTREALLAIDEYAETI